MSWKESSALEEKKKFVAAWNRQQETVTELCRQFEISRTTAYKYRARFEESGEAGLQELSRAPHHHPHAVSEETIGRILEVRQQHPRWGPRKIVASLERKWPKMHWPATSTIGDVLQREGLVIPRRKRVRVPAYSAPLAHAEVPNRVWCADFKGWFLCGDGSRCDPLTCSDAMSRFLLRCRAVPKTDGAEVRAKFEAMFREYGLPDAIRTDNGPPFASKAPGGLTRLSMWWLRLGIQHERIAPGCPQQNGRHERLHLTLKQETASPPRATLRQQQKAFLEFERMYNQERPHEALDNRTPAEVYVNSERPYQARLPELEYPAGAQLRWVSQQGSVKWKSQRTFLSEVFAREAVGLIEVDQDYFQVYYGPLLVGWLDGSQSVFERVPEELARAGRPASLRPFSDAIPRA